MDPRRVMRSILAAAITLVWLAAALPTVACSCVAFRGFDQVADGEHIVVAGVAEARAGSALTIRVDRWFWGPAPSPHLVVTDEPASMCAVGPSAPLGERWLWVAWVGDVRPVVNQCLPSWSLADAEGERAFSVASARFGGIPMPLGVPLPPEDPSSGVAWWFLLGGAGVAGVIVFGAGVALSGRRGRERADR